MTMTSLSNPAARKGILCAFLTSLIFCANHYCRDAPGTVEEQLALDSRLAVSPQRYALLTAIYFTPSALVPLGLAVFSSVTGVQSEIIFLVCSWIGVAGNSIAGIGAARGSFITLLVGRGVAGMVYEAVDMMSMGFLPRMLPGGLWPICSGVINGILRLGSIAAFLSLPVIYTKGGGDEGNGLGSVFLAVALVASFMGPLASVVWCLATGRADASFEKIQNGSASNEHTNVTEIDSQSSSDESDSSQREGDVGIRSRLVSKFKSVPQIFWIYVLGGSAMYSSVIPFWFYGSGILQRTRGFSLEAADSMMIFPEGIISVLSVPTGLLVSYFKLGFVAQQRALAVAAFCVTMSYLLLVAGAPASFAVVALGSSYAVSNQLFWSTFPDACPLELSTLGAGIVSFCINVGATIVPPMIGIMRESMPQEVADVAMLLLLGSFGLIASLIAMITSHQASGYEAVPDTAYEDTFALTA